MSEKREKGDLTSIGDVLRDSLLEKAYRRSKKSADAETPPSSSPTSPQVSSSKVPGRWDFDLAEFPLFYLYKNTPKRLRTQPLLYEDTISGKGGERVTRSWTVHPGHLGFGGPSTQDMLFDLIQIYGEQGFEGDLLHFGTLNSIYRRRHGKNAGKSDYARMQRDITILRGYDFHAQNAFWDRRTQSYVSMEWRLFGNVYYATARPKPNQLELPFGCIEVNAVLQEIARTRGFFAIGFDVDLYHDLSPMGKRLAQYLAKRFMFEKIHRRSVEGLCEAFPIHCSRDDHKRQTLKRAAEDLLSHKVPILEGYRFYKRDGHWMAEFVRAKSPLQPAYSRPKFDPLKPGLESHLDLIIQAVNGEKNRSWWTNVVNAIGEQGVHRALGELRENLAHPGTEVRNPAGLLTKICIDIAEQLGTSIPRAGRR